MRSDEMWHFYAGSALALHVIGRKGEFRTILVGKDPGRGQAFQAVVEAGSWFAASVTRPKSYSLVGCTVAPGFEYQDWDLGAGSWELGSGSWELGAGRQGDPPQGVA